MSEIKVPKISWKILHKINDGDFGYCVDVSYDLKFPKQAEQVATSCEVYRQGHRSNKILVNIGVYENRLYI